MNSKKELNEKSSEIVQELVELGKFYFVSQKFDQAIKEFKEALKLEPKNAEIFYQLGVSFEAINDHEQAKTMFERVLELDNNNKLAKEHLDNLYK